MARLLLARDAARARARGLSPLVLRDLRNGLLFIAPWLVGLLVFTIYPILASFYYSFTEYDIVSPPKFVGLANYQELLTADPLFYQAVGNTLFYAVIAIPTNLVVAILIAMLLNTDVRGQ